ncbi:hypothetical protein GPECTOR_54g236 [Gonium pectorale]|uniref:Uncharacterized protein n=1 Tax=Gonium pectorale TaxID=33097 RepID=A0A150G7H2_GONPE|nr:hypothetical protein GPECTOR_54g236 [Gonium pectorale]|eukprot:KXZ45495.1 hypothetical protein GPECTOR_54g236 [Gonium pectorale]
MVTTLLQDMKIDPWDAAILPNGVLALYGAEAMCFLDLALKPPDAALPSAASPPPGLPRRTLPADLGALLDRQLHSCKVRQRAPGSLKRLMLGSPDLMLELVGELEERRAKVPRTG